MGINNALLLFIVFLIINILLCRTLTIDNNNLISSISFPLPAINCSSIAWITSADTHLYFDSIVILKNGILSLSSSSPTTLFISSITGDATSQASLHLLSSHLLSPIMSESNLFISGVKVFGSINNNSKIVFQQKAVFNPSGGEMEETLLSFLSGSTLNLLPGSSFSSGSLYFHDSNQSFVRFLLLLLIN